jgi:hypothetical protein
LDDLEWRLKRAKHHLDDLNAHVKQLGLPRHCETIRGSKLKGGGYVLQIADQEPVPPVLGLIAADFVHNLRSLLDNLMWELSPSSLRGNKSLAFPLCETRLAFRKFSKTILNGKLPARTVAALKGHQPYKRTPDDVGKDRLRLLHQMWNADKHHAPIAVMGGWPVAMGGAARGDRPEEPPFGFTVGPLGKRNEVGWMSAEGAERYTNPRVVLDIGFQTRRPTLAVPRHALIKMYDIVSKEVLPDFREFL